VAAVAVAAIAPVAACGFDGDGSMGGVGAALPEGGGREATIGTEPDGALGDAGELFDDGGNVVLLDSATLPVETVDAGDSGTCPANSYRCAATGECVTVCAGCAGAPLRCAASSTCVDKCTGCTGRTFECWACASNNDVSLAKVTCEPSGDTCYGNGFTRCNCGRLGGCYGSEQICLGSYFSGYFCRGCGESDTNGRRCVGSGQPQYCTAATRTCN
jgi:hypothetical protein